MCYFLPFVSTLGFYSFLPSVRINSEIPVVTSSLRFKSFISLRLSLCFTSLINPICYFFPFVSPLTVRLFLELFRCNSFLSFVTSFLLFPLFPSVRLFLSFQLFPVIRFFAKCCGMEQSGLALQSKQLLAATCDHLLPCGHLQTLAPTGACGHLRPLAATCGHSSGWKWLQVAAMHLLKRPLEASAHSRPLMATCGHLRPRVAASGCRDPLRPAATCGHLWPLAVTCGHCHSSGCKWLQVAAMHLL